MEMKNRMLTMIMWKVQGFTTPLPTTKSLSAQKEKGIKNVLDEMGQGCEEVMEAPKEILDIMRRSASNRSSSSESEPHEIVDQINKSMMLIGTCRNKLKKLCRKKRAIKTSGDTTSKKIKSISKSIKAQRTMIATLENGMDDQHMKLESITKLTGDTDDEVSRSGIEDNSSKDNDEEASNEGDNNEGDVDGIDDDKSDN
jgi:hypothetical protein